MLQIITRVTDMQMNLEHPEVRAKNVVQDRMELNNKGEIELPEIASEALTSEATRSHSTIDSPTSKFIVVMIDDNEDFLKFASARLKYVYDFHIYNDIMKAADDLDEMKCDIVVCKQEMPGMTGSELCNQLKTNFATQNIKFVLMTDGVLTPQDMHTKNITVSADDYLAKPFNMQEATMRFNQVLGLGPIKMNSNLIEGAETRMLEEHNTSMTTATENIGMEDIAIDTDTEISADDPMNKVDTTIVRKTSLTKMNNLPEGILPENELGEEVSSDYSMLDAMDQQLIKNIEQYVMQNMSR